VGDGEVFGIAALLAADPAWAEVASKCEFLDFYSASSLTRSQAVAEIADRTASQQTI